MESNLNATACPCPKLGLEQLPIEILQHIVYLLATPCCSCAEWNESRRRFPLRSNPFASSSSASLSALSLVSKVLNKITRPAQFETIYLTEDHELESFSNLLSKKSRGLAVTVEARWVRCLVVRYEIGDDGARHPIQSIQDLTTIFTLCGNVRTVELSYLNVPRLVQETDDFQQHLLALWNSLPTTLQNLWFADDLFVPRTPQSYVEHFVKNHSHITMMYFGHLVTPHHPIFFNLFPHLTRVCFDTNFALPNPEWKQDVDWSSLTWLRINTSLMNFSNDGNFSHFKYPSLISLELGPDVHFRSRVASSLFSKAPKLEELHYEIGVGANSNEAEVGWGTRDESTQLFVRHQNLKHIEVVYRVYGLEATSDLTTMIAAETGCLCNDFRGLTSEDFPSLHSLDIFVETYPTGAINLEFRILETLREEMEGAIGVAIIRACG